MIPILTCDALRRAEQATFSALNIPSRVVMESAGRACSELIFSKYSNCLSRGVIVFAGSGNNGGDGFVIARLLKQRDVEVKVISLSPLEKATIDTASNIKSFLALDGEIIAIDQKNWQRSLANLNLCEKGLFVDAIFGTGFHGELEGLNWSLCEEINKTSVQSLIPVFSVDIPSGVSGDTAEVSPGAIVADCTLTFQALKPGLVHYPAAANGGDLYLADIGIELDRPIADCSAVSLIERDDIRQRILSVASVARDSHKGRKGHVVVVGGSRGHYGAPKITARAALRSGAGLVTVTLPKSVEEELSPQLFELMSSSFAEESDGCFAAVTVAEVERLLHRKDSCVIGPGMGTEGERGLVLSQVISSCNSKGIPLVIDADALNILAQDRLLLSQLSTSTVLTPHPGEMSRLLGLSVAEIQSDRIGVARRFSVENKCWTILKGARTAIASPEGRVWINPAATAALATAGSGDALAGIIAGLMAQGLTVEDSVLVGVYLHGCAGESLEDCSLRGMGIVAGDIIEQLPKLILEVAKSELLKRPETIRLIFKRRNDKI